MSASEGQSESPLQCEQVLTLDEAAAYLRISAAELAKLARKENVPAQKIAKDWRFLRRTLDDWLRFPGISPRESGMHLRWVLESPLADELLVLLEDRLLQKRKQSHSEPPPGSKQAVLKRFGVFGDDSDLEEQLEAIHRWREAGG